MSRTPRRRLPPAETEQAGQQDTLPGMQDEKTQTEPARKRGPRVAGRTPWDQHRLQEFGRRLHAIRVRLGMSQSDVARAVWGTMKDKRGYEVARNRDRISSYEAGRDWPEPANLARIAEVLGVKPEELAPDITAATVDRDAPAVSITMAAGHPDKVHLYINMLVPRETASRVFALLTAGGEG